MAADILSQMSVSDQLTLLYFVEERQTFNLEVAGSNPVGVYGSMSIAQGPEHQTFNLEVGEVGFP